MRPTNLEEAIFDRWGRACVICSRTPDEWLDTDLGARRQDKLSLHHVNGDETDQRVENVIPLCQSCHVHVHRVDEPPYRKWHRQLPLEHRHAWNAHYSEYYEGPRLTRAEAERRFGDDAGVPESVKYLEHEREGFDPSEFEADDPTGEAAGTDDDDVVADGGDDTATEGDTVDTNCEMANNCDDDGDHEGDESDDNDDH
ncbi:HNH endonuclease [Halovenus rubra]|uniref:HNH endonuclease n=2 Tax=Halovenus rubra TaxID=869890 RepID=A0ACC7E3M4_9EURY|nr:HNH endonuclease [Halovenus rubra]